jgi:lysophospholipase L1-like esterase
MLGGKRNKSGFEVLNYGVSGRTAMRTGDLPYINELEMEWALHSDADVVVLMLGTNDAKSYQWNEDRYVHDLTALAKTFLAMKSKPALYVLIPPPLYADNFIYMNQTVINGMLPKMIPHLIVNPLLEKYGPGRVTVVSIFEAMGGTKLSSWEAFCNLQSCDHCHPNDSGYTLIAMAVFKALAAGQRGSASLV